MQQRQRKGMPTASIFHYLAHPLQCSNWRKRWKVKAMVTYVFYYAGNRNRPLESSHRNWPDWCKGKTGLKQPKGKFRFQVNCCLPCNYFRLWAHQIRDLSYCKAPSSLKKLYKQIINSFSLNCTDRNSGDPHLASLNLFFPIYETIQVSHTVLSDMIDVLNTADHVHVNTANSKNLGQIFQKHRNIILSSYEKYLTNSLLLSPLVGTWGESYPLNQ